MDIDNKDITTSSDVLNDSTAYHLQKPSVREPIYRGCDRGTSSGLPGGEGWFATIGPPGGPRHKPPSRSWVQVLTPALPHMSPSPPSDPLLSVTASTSVNHGRTHQPKQSTVTYVDV